MKSAERIRYFYEIVISENQIGRMAEFISPECCVKMGEKLIPAGIDQVIDGLIVEHGGAVNTFETLLEAGVIRADCFTLA